MNKKNDIAKTELLKKVPDTNEYLSDTGRRVQVVINEVTKEYGLLAVLRDMDTDEILLLSKSGDGLDFLDDDNNVLFEKVGGDYDITVIGKDADARVLSLVDKHYEIEIDNEENKHPEDNYTRIKRREYLDSKGIKVINGGK